MQLHEQYRPKDWDDVVGQDEALETIQKIGQRGFGGRAFFICGDVGTGKTTIARLIASEVAEKPEITAFAAATLTSQDVKKIKETVEKKRLSEYGRAYLFDGADALSSQMVGRMASLLNDIPEDVVFVFMSDRFDLEKLYQGSLDAETFLTRCYAIKLAREGLSEVFAMRAKSIAEAEDLSSSPIEDYLKLADKHGNDLRGILNEIECGEMSE